MQINYTLFSFPNVSNVHACFFFKGPEPGDPFAGNLAYEVGEHPERVAALRAAVCEEFRTLGLSHIVDVHQVHGDSVIFSPGEDCTGMDADGLASDTPHKGLLIKTADCQPILLTARDGRAILALHVGWRGNRLGFIEKAVRRFCDHYALDAADLLAVRGPSLSPQQAEFQHADTEWGPDFAPWFDQATKTMDLWELTRHQLREAGLCARNIFGLDICTKSNPTCFSYRRDKVCGRQGGLIWLA